MNTNIFENMESNVRSYCRSFPTVFTKAKGSVMTDENGKDYIDFFSGAGALNFGHNPDIMVERIISHLQSDGILHSMDMYTPCKREFLEYFQSNILNPRGLDYKIQFAGPTGTNAVEAAIKIARRAKNRQNIFALMGAFHGMTLGSLALTTDNCSREGAGQALQNVTHIPAPYMFPEFDTIQYMEMLLTDDHSGVEKPAAIILETVQADGGINVFDPQWLRRVRQLCDKHDILMIVDDIQVGCGRTGMRMLKTAYWAGQIDGYSLKIRVYDKSAHAYREDFYRQCPGLKDDPTIQFVQTDVCSASFHEQLLAPENSAYATYIVVAMGSDQLNLSVSNELFKAYRRHTGFDDSKMPEIFTRIRAQAKSEPYFHNAEFLEKRHIHLFGSTASIFSDKTIFDTELENLALAVHLTYQGALQLDPESADYRAVANSFKTSEYDRRSSMAVALHIPAKLCMCDKIVNTGKNNVTPENIRIFAECLKTDPDLPERLARNEHDRWNAFMLSEGYQPASVEEMHLYAGTVGNNRDDLTKLHPCIAPWDALDELENIYNDTYHKHKRYKEYDYIIVKSVPDIWAAAQKMGEKV